MWVIGIYGHALWLQDVNLRDYMITEDHRAAFRFDAEWKVRVAVDYLRQRYSYIRWQEMPMPGK